MRIAIICPDYPSESSSSFTFVHVRSKLYQKYSHNVEVFIKSESEGDYHFEGIPIHKISNSQIELKIRKFNPDVVAVHFPTFWMIPLIKKLEYPKVVWIHGHEILWTFSLMSSKNYLDWIKKRVVLLPRLAYQIYLIRNFLKQLDYIIFVSNWLLKAAKNHTLSNFQNAFVIPNPVDTRLFSYRVPQNFTKGISVRSLERSVYGLDIAIKAFSKFDKANLTIYGKGRFYNKFTKMISKFKSNTKIRFEYIRHNNLPNLYHQNGFFVAPSRRETQGLAMCEAMSCGLPVVASKVGGIPEFVRDELDGYLVSVNKPQALRDAVVRLLSDKERFYEMSWNARSHIESICDAEIVTKRELCVMKKAADEKSKE